MSVVRLLPLFVLFALGAFVLAPRPAQANLGALAVSLPTATVGQQVTATATLTSINSATVNLTATGTVFLSGNVTSGTGEVVTGTGTASLSFTALSTTANATLSALFACQTPGTITLTLTQSPAPSAGSTSLTASVLCTAVTTGSFTVTPSPQGTSLPATISGTCTSAGQLLTAAGRGAFSTAPAPTNMTVISPTSTTCMAPGIFSVGFVCSMDGIVTFNLSGITATLTCAGNANPYTPTGQFCPLYNAVAPYTGGIPSAGQAPYTGSPFSYAYNGSLSPYNGYQYGYGYNGYNGTGNNGVPYQNGYNGLGNGYNGYTYAPPVNACPPNPATLITATTSSPSVSCGGTALVNITIRDGGGLPVINGQQVTLTASLGTITPSSTGTLAGAVTATYTAPTTGSGTATIAIADGTATTSTTITVNCTATPPTPIVQVSSAPATTYIMPSTTFSPPNTGEGSLGGVRILPPNTGDAGLRIAEVSVD